MALNKMCLEALKVVSTTALVQKRYFCRLGICCFYSSACSMAMVTADSGNRLMERRQRASTL